MFHKGDFFDIITKYEDNYFDLCITDPPYNVDAKAYSQSRAKRDVKISYDDKMDEDAYYAFSIEWFTEVMRTCKLLVFSPGHLNIDMWSLIEKPKDFLIHNKPDGQGFSGQCMTTKSEIYLVYGKSKRRWPTNTIVANLNHHIRYGKHPHPKPPELYEKIIKPIQPLRVLDPFAGSGTTAFVCEKLGIDYVTCEIDPSYWEDIDNRIEAGKRFNISSDLWEV